MTIKKAEDLYNKIENNISKKIVGKSHDIKLLTTALLSNGHVIIEGVPGIAKTLLAKSFAESLKLEFKRKVREIGFENTLCFDEVGFQLEMNPRYGWSKKGKRCTMIKKKGGIQEVL